MSFLREEMLVTLFDGPEVTGEQMLLAREARSEYRKAELLRGNSLLYMTINVPGTVKTSRWLRWLFDDACRYVIGAYRANGVTIAIRKKIDQETGPEALFTVKASAVRAKEIAVELEETYPLGRVLDLDVFDETGTGISRVQLGRSPRRCYLCGEAAHVCARGQKHTQTELRKHLDGLFNAYLRESVSDKISAAAQEAMLTEAAVAPKPGLVDRFDSGSHHDMDFFTFLKSSVVLRPWMKKMALLGMDLAKEPEQESFVRLKPLGKAAEAAMFSATEGVNTHKGLIFSMGLVCAAAGRASVGEKSGFRVKNVLLISAQMARQSVSELEEGKERTCLTNGERVYREYQITGIRGEAAGGFPSVANIGLPVLREKLAQGYTLNDASLYTLVALMTCVQDTNIISRADKKTLDILHREIYASCRGVNDIDRFYKILSGFNVRFQKLGISPGGCADLLAITLMLHFMFDL